MLTWKSDLIPAHANSTIGVENDAILIQTFFSKNSIPNVTLNVFTFKRRPIINITISFLNGSEVIFLNGNKNNFIQAPFQITLYKPYVIMVFFEDEQEVNELQNILLFSENILYSLPKNIWLGIRYLNYYMEFIKVMKRAYEELIKLNQYETIHNGVTINMVPWSTAYASSGYFVHGTSKEFHDIAIKNKLYLPNREAKYKNYGIGTRIFLDRYLHEMAHVIISPKPSYLEEDFACFFEAELFNLIGYRSEYREKKRNIYDLYKTYVGDNKTSVKDYIINIHDFPAPWIGAYILHELRIEYGRSLFKNYFSYVRTLEPVEKLNDDELFCFYFSKAAGVDLIDLFTNFGFRFRRQLLYQLLFLRISKLIISPHEGRSNETFKISFNVSNLGDITSNFTITLRINGTIEIVKKLTMSGSSTTNMTFRVSKSIPGTYYADINGEKGIFRVKVAPSVSFIYMPIKPTIQHTVNFYDRSSDPDGLIISWHWNFGDGTVSTTKNPKHNYIEKGTYTITITVTDDDGNSNSTTSILTIINLVPAADFTYSPTSPKVGEVILFTDNSTDPEGKKLKYLWDFGEGTISTRENSTHRYDEEGDYYVRLTVTDNNGGSNDIVKKVNVVQMYNLTLRVKDILDLGVSNVKIELFKNGEHYASGKLDEKGILALINMPLGNYEIRAKVIGLTYSKTCFINQSMKEQIQVYMSINTIVFVGGIMILILLGVFNWRKKKNSKG